MTEPVARYVVAQSVEGHDAAVLAALAGDFNERFPRSGQFVRFI